MHIILEQLHPCAVGGPATVIYFFSTSPIRLKLGLQKVGRLLIATYVDQSKHLANHQQVFGFAVPFASLSILCKNVGPKPFAESNQHVFTFLRSKFVVQCTGVVALSPPSSGADEVSGESWQC
jgi:hypothetical protein